MSADPGFVLVKPLPLYLCGFQGCQVTHLSRKSMDLHRARTHRLVRTYYCVVCGKDCRYLSTFDQHFRTHHLPRSLRKKKDEETKCPVCRNRFATTGSLKRHQKTFRHFLLREE